ncbi:MAG: hypothetical protein EOP84_25805 [Verrucomicrobiaceae bacterium]|nr:MAG: hypothetical protein EOP84_25805 [Verrucomicrobiaceae bacterium]
MKLQDQLVKETKAAAEEAFRYAKAVPADKQEWSPLDKGQTVLSMCRELAKCGDWSYDMLAGVEMDWSEEAQAKQQAEMNSWTSIEDCEKVANEKLERLYGLIKDYPDEKLTNTISLPFGPGGTMKDFTMAEIMDYPRWNCNYHLGQIGYIQTLYGDKEMH